MSDTVKGVKAVLLDMLEQTGAALWLGALGATVVHGYDITLKFFS